MQGDYDVINSQCDCDLKINTFELNVLFQNLAALP